MKKAFGVASVLILLCALQIFLLTSCSVYDYEEKSYDIDEDFRIIEVEVDSSDVAFLPSEDGKCRVDYFASEGIYHSVMVKDGKLEIDVDDKRSFFEHLFSLGKNKNHIAVYLPLDINVSLLIENDTGDIEIPSDFIFDSIDIELDTGNVVCNADARDSITIDSDTGNIQADNIVADTVKLENETGKIVVTGGECTGFSATTDTGDIVVSNVKCKNEFKTSVDTGKVDLSNVSCGSFVSTGDTGEIVLTSVVAEREMTIKRDTGDVRFSKCDAAEIEITTGTGDVKGSFLTNKIFTVKTDVGRLDLPESEIGGKCKISTTVGDIKITIEN